MLSNAATVGLLRRTRTIRGSSGVSSLETALLLPFMVLFILYAMQIAFVFVSHQIAQYAAFMAARSYQVYGAKTLDAIQYRYTASRLGVGNAGGLMTDGTQTIAEAAAEKIIFESLPWEHERITVVNDEDWYMERVYEDGPDENTSVNGGGVRVDFVTDPVTGKLPGVKLTYCMPVLFPGLTQFFNGWESPNPCANLRARGDRSSLTATLTSVPIQQTFFLGREP